MTHGSRWAAVNCRCDCEICAPARVEIRRRENQRRTLGGSITCTLEHLPTGRRIITTVAAETTVGALAELCDGLEPDAWRLVTVSTPATILADLKGRSAAIGGRPCGLPEQLLAGPAGCAHLLEGRAA